MVEPSRGEREYIRVKTHELRRFIEDLLTAAGVSAENAGIAAQIFYEADLQGTGAQGLDYLPYVLDSLRKGLIDGNARPAVIRETASSALIDGNRGLGQPAALLAVELATAKSMETGCATVAVCNSTDIFMIGAYARRFAERGLIGIATTSGPPLVHPYGGTERLLSTNPIAFGFPREGAPLVFDMATSAAASSRVRQAAYYGEQMPPGTGIGPDGKPTTDAAAIRKGAISPLSGHKGFGLALCLGLLCGPLTGSGIGPELAGWQATGETKAQGHMFLAIDPEKLAGLDHFISRSEWYLSTIKNSHRADPASEIRIPGERASETIRVQSRDGIRLLAETWDIVGRYAKELGVSPPAVLEPEVSTS